MITYNFGGSSLPGGIPTILFESELEVTSLVDDKLSVNFRQKQGIAKFIRPKRVYQKKH